MTNRDIEKDRQTDKPTEREIEREREREIDNLFCNIINKDCLVLIEYIYIYIHIYIYIYIYLKFGLVSLFNCISKFMGYLMPKPILVK